MDRDILFDRLSLEIIKPGNETLNDMSNLKPSTPEEFLLVNGVGQKKLDTYGTIFMEEINPTL